MESGITLTTRHQGNNRLDVILRANEPTRDKTNKWHVRPAKTQISLGIRPVWSESSLSARRKLESLATHWAHSEDWSDWVDAQADLSLRWAHSHFVGFVMRRLKSCLKFQELYTAYKKKVYSGSDTNLWMKSTIKQKH